MFDATVFPSTVSDSSSTITLSSKSTTNLKNQIETQISNRKSRLPDITYNFLQNKFLDAIDNIGVDARNFYSMNLSQNKQNLYYKIIEQNWNEKIDKVVVYKGNYFTSPGETPFSGYQNSYAQTVNSLVVKECKECDDFLNPKTQSNYNNETLNPPVQKAKLNKEGRDFINLLSKAKWSNGDETKFRALSEQLNSKENQNKDPLFDKLTQLTKDAKESLNTFKSIIQNYYFNDKGYQLVVNITNITPITAQVTNKRSYEAIVNPTFARNSNKDCISYNEWQQQLQKPEEEFNAWLNKLSDKYKIHVDKDDYILIGEGLSPDFMYPIVSLDKPLPNLQNEVLLYLNKDGYSRVRDAYRNSETENMLLGKFKSNVKNYQAAINEINAAAKKYMQWPDNIQAAFLYDDTSNVMTPSALRLVYVPNIVHLINIISALILIFIIVSALIVSFILIKRFIDVNKTDIGVLLANGYRKIDVLFPLALIFSLFIAIGLIIGYASGFGLQIFSMNLFRNFWTIPYSLSTFNIVPFILFVILGVIVLGLFVLGVSFIVVKGDATSLIDSSSTCKVSRFSIWMKKVYRNKNPMDQLRYSFAFSSLFKLFTLTIMSGFIMTALTFGIAYSDSFKNSSNKTFVARNYNYSVDFDTPTVQGGQYYTVPYDKVAMSLYGLGGWDNPNNPNYNMGQYINETGPLNGTYQATSPNLIDKDQLEKRGYASNLEVFKNMITKFGTYQLPSRTDGIGDLTPTNELQYLSWFTQSKLFINASIFGNKPWDIAIKLMPANQRKYCEDANRKILSMMSGDITHTLTLRGFEAKTFRNILSQFVTSATEEEFNNGVEAFINEGYGKQGDEYKLSDKLPLEQLKKLDTKYWKLDLTKIVSLTKLNNDYILLVASAFNIPEYAKVNYLMTYNKIATMPGDKTYSYAMTNLDVKNQFVPSVKLIGISKQNESFLQLTNDNGDDLEDKIINSKINDFTVPVIVNKVFAKQYGVKINDTISADVLNTIDRHTRGNNKFNFWETATGKRAQSNINKFSSMIINNNNTFDADDYIRYKYKLKVIDILDTYQGNEIYTSQDNVNWMTGMTLFDTRNDQNIFDKENAIIGTRGIPFNGLFSNSEIPFQVSNNIAFYAPSGLYIGNDQTKAGLSLALKYKDNANKAKHVLGYTGDIKDINAMVSDVESAFGRSAYIALVSNMLPTGVLKDSFAVMDETLKFTTDATISLLLVVSYIIVTLITFILVTDSMKIASILKALGLSDTDNSLSLLLIYIPVVLIGILLTIPLLSLVSKFYVDGVFSFSGILLEIPILWWQPLVSSLAIITVFFIAFFIIKHRLKKKNLANEIK